MSIYSNPSSSTTEETAAYVAALLELLGAADPLAVLEATPAALEPAVAGLDAPEISRPEAPGKWSIRHVLRHLADSEVVFAFRLRMILAHDRPQLAGYDQDLWAGRLGYDEAAPAESRREFEALRAGNLRLIRRASPQDLQRVGLHAERGEESVAHLMRLYAAHDLLHLRQIARIRRSVTNSSTLP